MIKLNQLYILLVSFLAITIPASYSVEDLEDDDREGFGVMEREREREHDDEGLSIGSDAGNLILLVTIGAIIASVGFTGFKILRTKRPAVSKK